MTEYERIRKEIGKTLIFPCNESDWKACNNPKKWEEGYCMEKDCRDCITGQILSLDGIEIRATDQSLPENPHTKNLNPKGQGRDRTSIYGQAQETMLKAGFIKVEPKRK